MIKSRKVVLYFFASVASMMVVAAALIFLKVIPNPFFMMPPLHDTTWIKTQYHDLAYANTSSSQ